MITKQEPIKQELLLKWLKSATKEQVETTRTTRGYLLQVGYGHKKASAELAARLESVTGGVVTRKQLRPDDWAVIWPELAAA